MLSLILHKENISDVNPQVDQIWKKSHSFSDFLPKSPIFRKEFILFKVLSSKIEGIC